MLDIMEELGPFLGGHADWLLLGMPGWGVSGRLCSRMKRRTEQERLQDHERKILVVLHLQPPTYSPSLFPSVSPSSTSVSLAMGRREGKSNGGMRGEVRSWQLIVWPLGESERLRGRETRDPGRGRERIIKCPSKALISLTPQACQCRRTGD